MCIRDRYLHTVVPEDQLNDKIMEYGEYIKVVIMLLVVVALLFFMSRHLLKRRRGA